MFVDKYRPTDYKDYVADPKTVAAGQKLFFFPSVYPPTSIDDTNSRSSAPPHTHTHTHTREAGMPSPDVPRSPSSAPALFGYSARARLV
jgi:hypothetical protein